MADEKTLVDRIRSRAFDLRDKFSDGRGYAFKRDFPGWFNAFNEAIGLLLAAARDIERLEKERAEAYRHMSEARAGHADAVHGLTCEHHGLYRGETTGCCIHHRAKSRERDPE